MITPKPHYEINTSLLEDMQEVYLPPANQEGTRFYWAQLGNAEITMPERLTPDADDVSAVPMYYPDGIGNGGQLIHFAHTDLSISDISLKPNDDNYNNSIKPPYTHESTPARLLL